MTFYYFSFELIGIYKNGLVYSNKKKLIRYPLVKGFSEELLVVFGKIHLVFKIDNCKLTIIN